MLSEKYQFEISFNLFWSKFYFTKAINNSFTFAIYVCRYIAKLRFQISLKCTTRWDEVSKGYKIESLIRYWRKFPGLFF